MRYLLSVCLASVLLSACGGGGESETSGISTTPVIVNQVPILASANIDQTATVGVTFEYDATQGNASFTDDDSDPLTYTVSYDPAAQGLTDAAGLISGTPSSEGTITVTITASDGKGGSASDSFDIVIAPAGTDQNAVIAKFAGRIDLDNLENYAGQTIPDYITRINTNGNPISDAGATLGRVLFYDTALSFDDSISCSSCHTQSIGFTDSDIVSTGVDGGLTRRHSMRLVNTQFAQETNFFWDERAGSHEEQETQPLTDPNEHGFSGENGRPDFDALVEKLEALEYYQELFTFVYGDAEVTEERLQLALAQFTKSIWSFDSKFDEGRAQRNNNAADFPNFTADENAGKTLFLTASNQGGAGCQACHRAPEFDIRRGSLQNGVVGVAGAPDELEFENTRSPSLRDVAAPDGTPNGPFMHDGSLQTLLDVVNHYDQIEVPTTDPELRQRFLDTIDPLLAPNDNPQNLNLSDLQKAQLVAFLNTLSGSNVYTDAKWSDPF